MQITNLTKATAKQEFLQTYLPSSIVKQLNLVLGDELLWSIEKRNGEIVLVAVPIQKSASFNLQERILNSSKIT